jgi:hypothetical protein
MDKKYYTLEEMQKIKLKDNECWTTIAITQYELDTGSCDLNIDSKFLIRYMIVEKERKLKFANRFIDKIIHGNKIYTARKNCKYKIGDIIEAIDEEGVIFAKIKITNIIKFIDFYPFSSISFLKESGELYQISTINDLGFDIDYKGHGECYHYYLDYFKEQKSGYLIKFELIKEE